MNIFFDIETGPRPDEELAPMMPVFSAPSNYKDEDKIKKHIDKQREEWLEKAALCATTGKVLAIGIRRRGMNTIFASGNEAGDITAFWQVVEDAAREGDVMTGFAIGRFDIPFLVRRSWALKVRVPLGVYNGRYLNNRVFCDLWEEWAMGDRGEFVSLKLLTEFLGVGTKDSDGGKLFAERWLTDRKAAILYLEHDLALAEKVGERLLGITDGQGPTGTGKDKAPATQTTGQAPAMVTAGTAAAVVANPGVPQGAAVSTVAVSEDDDY